MEKIPEEVMQFFIGQSFSIVSTVDKAGFPHNACKGIVKISPDGEVYLLDLYRAATYHNLMVNPSISVTSVDEHKFKGYCLKGKAKAIEAKDFDAKLLKAWEDRINARITQRLIKNITQEKGHPRHPEAFLPKPEYLIFMQVEEVINLAPHQLRREG